MSSYRPILLFCVCVFDCFWVVVQTISNFIVSPTKRTHILPEGMRCKINSSRHLVSYDLQNTPCRPNFTRTLIPDHHRTYTKPSDGRNHVDVSRPYELLKSRSIKRYRMLDELRPFFRTSTKR